MTPFDPRRLETASHSDVGRIRENNEDHSGSAVGPDGALLLMVADGMGGHAGGAEASRMAVEVVESVFTRSHAAPDDMLRDALERANHQVHEAGLKDLELTGMGTTGVVLLFGTDGGAWVANVGDSRAYRLRAQRLEQLTHDHSLVAELQRRGVLTAEEAAVHPRRNEVLRSLGVEPEVEVDVLPIDVEAGDLFLLCSDGLCGVVSSDEISKVMLRFPPALAVKKLVDVANAKGGPDNVTVQIARVPEPLPVWKRQPGLLLAAAAVLVGCLALWRACS